MTGGPLQGTSVTDIVNGASANVGVPLPVGQPLPIIHTPKKKANYQVGQPLFIPPVVPSAVGVIRNIIGKPSAGKGNDAGITLNGITRNLDMAQSRYFTIEISGMGIHIANSTDLMLPVKSISYTIQGIDTMSLSLDRKSVV